MSIIPNIKLRFPGLFQTSIIVFGILAIISSFFAGKVFAADAFPPSGRIPCDTTKPVEFSSDRPYQASPCGDRPISYWCGNDVVINLGTVKTPYCDRKSGQATECPCTNAAQCDHTGGNFQKIDVDLTDVQLPILGNTQLTKNSQSPTDQIDDGTKTSNYVAWYLGGTNGKAEYGSEADPTTAEGISKIVDTSGPIKKLLPSIIQDSARLTTIKSATDKTTYSTIPDETEGVSGVTPQTVTENQNHNQIVVCANPDSSGFWALVQNFTQLGKFNPTDCYAGSGGSTQGSLKMRLSDWNDPLGAAVVENAVISGFIQGLKLIYPFIPAGAIETSIGNHWTLARPPLPWSDEHGLAFKTDAEYQKAYSEWRGNVCGIVPVINKVVCITNIFVPTKYADFYQYVPLANTTDKKGAHVVTNTHVDAPKATLEDVAYQILHSPQLYLAHSLEDYQLSTELKTTYAPKDTTTANGGAGVSASTIPNDVENNSQCRIIPSTTNPGDDVTFGNPKSHIEVNVEYRVTMIQCTDIHYVEPDCDKTGRCSQGHWEANCSSDVYATVNTIGKFAYNDEIWNNTVAGSDSIFRRIYPKTGANAPVSCISDTPAASNATYTLNNNSSQGLELLRVQEPDKSNVPSDDGKVANAQLYYPHYGGVLNYFLNGIQQALRPLGYGTGTPESGQYCGNIKCGDLPKLPKAAGSCNLGSSSINIPQSFKDIVSAAAQTYNTPPNLILGVMYGEGAFNTGGNGAYSRYDWTDANVKNWATCQPLPHCSGPDSSIVAFPGTWDALAQRILPDLQKIDPTKTQASPCNLLDATFALAKDLHDNAGGSSELTGKSCLGITMSSTNPSNCAWNSSQYETAIRVWEFGTQWGNTANGFLTCATKINSCATGGGVGAQCPTDTTGNADTCDNSVGANSHNACVYSIGTEGSSGNRR